MENSTKWILGGSALVGTIALLSGARLSRFSKEFILTVSPRVHSVSWTGMVLAIDITFKNPTDATLRLKHPTVTAFDSLASKQANTPFLSSTVSDAQITIQPNTETRLNPVMLTISLLDFSLLKTAFDLASKYIAGQAITLYVRALTQVNGTVPVVQESQSTFQRGKADQTKQLPKTAPKTAVSGLSGYHRIKRLSHGRR